MDTEEIRATDIQRSPKAQEPQENHHRDYHNPPTEEQWRVPGEPPRAEAPGSRNDEPTGPAGSGLRSSRSSHGPRGPRPRDTPPPKQRPDRAQGARPRQAATGSEPAHTKAPSPGYREPQVHQRAETPTTGRLILKMKCLTPLFATQRRQKVQFGLGMARRQETQ
ncbi:hypothetical protein AMECASPLE_030698 [Ameca splendens]|uniref:Uncharacterized protein n=1 Tax=Ameca splendens TaxID=208324 RepID=A0ABV0YT38_9TELE